MTRQEIIAAAVLDSGEYRKGPQSNDNPFSTNRWVDDAVVELCRITEYAYVTLRTDIVSGQSVSCLSMDLFYIESVTLTDAEDNLHVLPMAQTYDSNVIAPNFRAELPIATGTPNSIVFQGASNYLLYPTPDYTANNGLVFRGFGVLNGTTWAEDDDECPLPPRTHTAIVSYVGWRLAEANNDLVRADQRRRDWERGKGFFESEMRSLTDRHRHTFPLQRGYNYGFGDDISNL